MIVLQTDTFESVLGMVLHSKIFNNNVKTNFGINHMYMISNKSFEVNLSYL